ncbi:hypothetical protein [Hydrogenophaga crocea]|uniref:Uncharacterized protein n=1 Tax=Hydrogenophaga crocea TaxID=2716225 RepID=A0A6G8IEG5_9BURK|nr:hypothetical protein [Hydrogenophaga crocea]QIM51594.1 hypothetical protein G9Q37_05300 [Hydrogenophaga crocea]
MSLKQLKKLTREAEFQLIERMEPGGLKVTVIGDRVVHWWPESRRQTAYVEGSSHGENRADAHRVIQLATGEGE